jgi:hypothetical protein
MGPFPFSILLLDPFHHTLGCERRSASCLEPCGLMDRGAGTDAALRLPLRLRAPPPALQHLSSPTSGSAPIRWLRPDLRRAWPGMRLAERRICMRCTQLFVSSKAKKRKPQTEHRPATASTDHRRSEPAQSTEVNFCCKKSSSSLSRAVK